MEFEVEGIRYKVNKDGITVSVIRKYFKKYEGEVVIPSSVEYNGNEYSVTEIGWDAFSGCSGLTSVVIPDSVTEISSKAFAATPFYTNHPDGVVYLGKVLYKYKGKMPNDTKLIIKEGTVSIAPCAFDGCSGLTSVVIPDSVTKIGDSAFLGCSALRSVFIPSSVTEIGNSVFSGCGGLSSIVIPNSVTKIGEYAFYGCSGLTSIVIPDSVTEIGERAFSCCSGLESIIVGNGNPVYDSRDNCNAIIETEANKLIIGCKSTIIPDSVTEIGDCAFDGCSGLRSVVIPDSVTEISRWAFDGCSGLTSVVIPDFVTKIYGSAFKDCSGLTSVVISDSVTEIDAYAFDGCIGLTSVVIPDSVIKIGRGAFIGCSGLTTLVYNAKSCGLGESVVDGCDNLSTIVVGENVKSIPNKLVKVGSLNRVIVLAQEPPKCEALISEKNNITVFVPKEAYVRYWLDEYWRGISLCEFVPVETINLSKKDIFLGVNYKDGLQLTISPMDATHKEVIWKSDNPSVVSVDQSGNICGVSRGTANIIVEALDGSGMKAMCKVRVGEILSESVVVTPSSLRLERNRVADINCCVLPENAHNKAVEWSTTDAGVVAFRKNGDGSISVIGVSAGHAMILCKALDGGGACGVCDITVENR